MSFDIVHQEQFYSLVLDDFHIQVSNVPLAVIKEFLISVADRYKRKIDILEYGSGMSTIWYGKTFPEANIISIEGNAEWKDRVSGWLDKEGIKNVDLRFIEQTADWRTPEEVLNPDYLKLPDGEFDLVINDGCVREMVAETILLNIDKTLKPGGLYLRHDYEKLIKGDWIGKGLNGKYERITYEDFCVQNPKYSVITLNGNGTWSGLAEFGGLWRRPY